jgi:hypothetical protein
MGGPSTISGWISLGIVASLVLAAYIYIPEVASGSANTLAELFSGVITPVIVALAGM